MRILFATPLHLPNMGGLEVLVAQLAPQLQARGHELRVLTATTGPDTQHDEIDGIPIFRANTFRALSERNPAELLRTQRAAAAFVEELDPELVHSHSMPPALWMYLRSAGERRVPIVVTLHNVMSDPAAGFSAASVKLLREADWITGVSQDVVDDIVASNPWVEDRISLVTNGIEVPEAEITPVPDGPPHFVCIGRLVAQKGFDRAVAAVGVLAPRVPDLRLTIAGDGPLREELRSQAKALGVAEHIEFPGMVEHADIAPLLRNSIAAVMPSRYEGLPLVALEAAFAGRPVVGTTAPGLARAVTDHETGLLVDADDPTALANAMESLIVDRGYATALGAAARARAEREWSLGACVDGYEAVYRTLVVR